MNIAEIKEPIVFDWDEGNSNKNWERHGVTQREAEQAFFDEHKFATNDTIHSETEKRFVLIAKTKRGRLLYIVYTMREKDHNKKVRIISARDMSKKKEVAIYEKAINSTKVQK